MTQINLDIQNTEVALEGIGAVAEQARKELVVLDDQLLTLRMNFGRLRSAITAAFAPVTATVTPMLNSAIRALTDFCDSAGSVMAALFGTVYKKAVTTTKAAGGAIRRTLASFDQIERLQGGSGGGSTTKTVELTPINDPLTPQLQQIVDTIRGVMSKLQSLLAPLKTIDFTPAADAFRRLGEAIGGFGTTVLTGLESAWHTLLVPLSQWCIEAAVPAAVDVLTAAFSALQAILVPLQAGFSALRTALTPFAQFLADTVILTLRTLQTQFDGLRQAFLTHTPAITGSFQTLSAALSGLWERSRPALERLRDFFLQLLGAVGDVAAGLPQILSGVTGFLSGVFAGNWGSAWENLKSVLRGAVNGIISLLNTLLRGLASGINAVARTLNGFSVTVPNWVPVLGGKRYGFSIPTVTAPQIPYLAQGAVLPANKPFLAMVGDQRHGTNIEAPLATIQEAVALVMQDQTSAIMAGFSASVEVQREILSAVLGISIGDEVIAAAYDRYRSRQAVMKGESYAF